MYSHRNEFSQEFGNYAENDSSKIVSCICASANTGPACSRAKIEIPQDHFLHVLVLCCGYLPLLSFWVVGGGAGFCRQTIFEMTTHDHETCKRQSLAQVRSWDPPDK